MTFTFSTLQIGLMASAALVISSVAPSMAMQAATSGGFCSPVLDSQGNCIYLICDENPRLRTCDDYPEGN